ncbi:MAG: hypothetical protein ACE5J3_12660 [Methanosarcinales archaeon]
MQSTEKPEKQWIEEALKKGMEKGKEESIISVLSARFKKVPKRIQKKIRSISEDSTLEELLIAVATINSITEFYI